MTRLHPDELGELLSAYIDRELDAAQTARVERLLREDESARTLLAELRSTVNAVASLPRHPAPPSIAADVQAVLERSALLGDAPPVRPHVHHTRVPWTARFSIAAMLAVVAAGGWWFVRDRSARGPVSDAPASFREIKTESLPPSTAPAERLALATRPERSLDEKLAAGIEPAALRSHAFDAETVRMQVSVRDVAERDALASRLTRRLNDQRVVDLAKDGTSPSAELAGQAFFLRGSPGVNFSPPRDAQILVRATPTQIDDALAEVGKAASSADSAAFQAGPLNVQGLDKSRALVKLLAPPQPAAKEESAVALAPDKAPAADAVVPSSDPSLDWINTFLETIGVDPNLVAQSSPEQAGRGTDDGAAERFEDSPATERDRGPIPRPEATVSAQAKQGDESAGEKRDAARRAAAGRRNRTDTSPPPGLVESRLNALSNAAALPASPEPYITLVIELIPPPDAATPPLGKPSPPSAPRRPSESPEKR